MLTDDNRVNYVKGDRMKISLAAVSLLALLALIAPANAQQDRGVAALNSQTFFFTSWCTGRDMVFRWSIDGKPSGDGNQPPHTEYGRSYIYPWLAHQIAIRGVEVTVMPPSGWPSLLLGSANFRWLMVGNNASGDIMLSLPELGRREINWFPSGTGFKFPGKDTMTPMTYIDLHGACFPGSKANVAVNIYYTSDIITSSTELSPVSHPATLH